MKTKENRGGRREGTGRPPKEPNQYDDSTKQDAMKWLNAEAKVRGYKNPWQAMAEFVLTAKSEMVRALLWKQYVEMNVVKRSKQTVDINHFEMPQVYLPEPMVKPAEAEAKEREFRQIN